MRGATPSRQVAAAALFTMRFPFPRRQSLTCVATLDIQKRGILASGSMPSCGSS